MSVWVSKDEADTGLSVLIVPLTTQQLPHIVALAVGLKCITHTGVSCHHKESVSLSAFAFYSSCPSSFSASFVFRPQQTNGYTPTLVKTTFTFSLSTLSCASCQSAVTSSVIELSMTGFCCRGDTPSPPSSSCQLVCFYLLLHHFHHYHTFAFTFVHGMWTLCK